MEAFFSFLNLGDFLTKKILINTCENLGGKLNRSIYNVQRNTKDLGTYLNFTHTLPTSVHHYM